MIKLLGSGFLALAVLATFHLPSSVLGNWRVGMPYDVGQPIGLNAKQEEQVTRLNIKFAPDSIEVCGKKVLINSMDVDRLTGDGFLTKYNFTANLIGLKGADVVDIYINKLHSTKACGEFADPGSHLLISDRHVVMEVGNDYFPLKRQ